MKRKPHPNRKQYIFPRITRIPKPKKLDRNLVFAIIKGVVICMAMLSLSFYVLYDTCQKINVYQKGKVVNMRLIEKSESYGTRNRKCTIKLYYDGSIYTENVNANNDYTIGSTVKRRFLKGSPVLVTNIFSDLILDIVLIFLFSSLLFLILKNLYLKGVPKL